jgi:hypothetical protein
MKEQIETRLVALRTEMEAGQKMMAELETKQAHMRSTLLRISGAIQVLEELLNQGHAERTASANGGSAENMPATASRE